MQRQSQGRMAEGRDLAGGHVRGADGLVRDRRDRGWHGRGQGAGEPGRVDRGVDAADATSPVVTTSLVPARTASWVPATDPAPTDTATGSRRTPVDSGP